MVVRTKEGEIRGKEIKTGDSPYKQSQRAKDAEIATVGGVAHGRKAEEAGLAGAVKFPTDVERY